MNLTDGTKLDDSVYAIKKEISKIARITMKSLEKYENFDLCRILQEDIHKSDKPLPTEDIRGLDERNKFTELLSLESDVSDTNFLNTINEHKCCKTELHKFSKKIINTNIPQHISTKNEALLKKLQEFLSKKKNKFTL